MGPQLQGKSILVKLNLACAAHLSFLTLSPDLKSLAWWSVGVLSAETFGVAEAGDAVGGVAVVDVPLLDESNLAEDRTVER